MLFPKRHDTEEPRVCFLATMREIRELVKAGLASTYGSKQKIHGAVLVAGPTRPQPGTSYSHRRFIPDTYTDCQGNVHRNHPLDANANRVFTLKRLDKSTAPLFDNVMRSAMGRREILARDLLSPQKSVIHLA